MEYKFDGKKYVTKGIAETLPPDVQLFLFMCLNITLPPDVQLFLFMCLNIMHDKTTGQLDYLQVFKLETTGEENSKLLHIRHEQEQPEAHMDYVMPTEIEINCKVYIIDDIDHVTMLLAEEY